MRNEAIEFCKRLGVDFFEELIPHYEEAKENRDRIVPRMFDKKRIIEFNDKYNVFRHIFDEVLAAIDEIGGDDDLTLYNCVLWSIIKSGKKMSKIMPAPRGVSRKTDFAPAPGVLWFLEEGAEILEKRGLPLEIVSDSIFGIESEMLAYFDMHGRYGMRDHVDWYLYFIRGEIIRVGRLQYQHVKFSDRYRVFKRGDDVAIFPNNIEMHKNGSEFGSLGQTDEEEKYIAECKVEGNKVTGFRADRYGEVAPIPVTLEGYSEAVCAGDNLFAIHITNGEPFNIDLIRESFAACDEVIDKYYSDLNIKGYIGFSWVFNKHLRDLIGRDTNITMLADLFEVYPFRGGHHGIYEYVFTSPDGTPYEQLPERTSMQRAIKKYLLDGNLFIEKSAIKLR